MLFFYSFEGLAIQHKAMTNKSNKLFIVSRGRNGYISPHRQEWHLRKRIGCKRFLFETQDIIRNLWLSKKGYVCACVCLHVCVFKPWWVHVRAWQYVFFLPFLPSLSLSHFLVFIMSSSSQIFCVRNKVRMRNFTGGRGKNTLDYMVKKYESDMYELFRTLRFPPSPQLQVTFVIAKC